MAQNYPFPTWKQTLRGIYERCRASAAWPAFSALHDAEDCAYWDELDRLRGVRPPSRGTVAVQSPSTPAPGADPCPF